MTAEINEPIEGGVLTFKATVRHLTTRLRRMRASSNVYNSNGSPTTRTGGWRRCGEKGGGEYRPNGHRYPVTVTNVDEPGKVELSALQPKAGVG